MKLTRRRAELLPKALAACQELIGRGIYPTGPKLCEKCPGCRRTILLLLRDHLIESGAITVVQFWPESTDAIRFGLGPPAVLWPESTDRYRWGTGGRNRNHPARRRTAAEVTS